MGKTRRALRTRRGVENVLGTFLPLNTFVKRSRQNTEQNTEGTDDTERVAAGFCRNGQVYETPNSNVV